MTSSGKARRSALALPIQTTGLMVGKAGTIIIVCPNKHKAQSNFHRMVMRASPLWELLVPVLDSRPQLLHGNLGLAAIVNSEMLVGHGIRVADLARGFHGIEEQLQSRPGYTHGDDALVLVVSGSPQKIALMRANGLWQAVLWPEKINRRGLAVGVSEDRRFGTDLWW